MDISKKIKMAAASGALAAAAGLFMPAIAQAEPQGIIGSQAVVLTNPTAEELLLFGQFGTADNEGGGQVVFRLPGSDAAGNGNSGLTWYDIIAANAEAFAAIGVETGNETPPYSGGGVSA
jgi:hypothetical protein